MVPWRERDSYVEHQVCQLYPCNSLEVGSSPNTFLAPLHSINAHSTPSMALLHPPLSLSTHSLSSFPLPMLQIWLKETWPPPGSLPEFLWTILWSPDHASQENRCCARCRAKRMKQAQTHAQGAPGLGGSHKQREPQFR